MPTKETNPWIIKPGEEMDVTIHGFSPEKEIPLRLITQLCESINEMPKKIKNNFPYKVREKLKKYPDWRRWHIKTHLYIYIKPCFFYKEKSVKSKKYAQFRKAVSLLHTLPAGENVESAISAAVISKEETDISILSKYIPDGAIVKCAGETVALFPANKVAEQLNHWKERILCYKFSLRVNIGRNDCPADAVWWIEYQTGASTINDNIVGSTEGKWQLLPKRNGRVENFLSLDEVIKKINDLATAS